MLQYLLVSVRHLWSFTVRLNTILKVGREGIFDHPESRGKELVTLQVLYHNLLYGGEPMVNVDRRPNSQGRIQRGAPSLSSNTCLGNSRNRGICT